MPPLPTLQKPSTPPNGAPVKGGKPLIQVPVKAKPVPVEAPVKEDRQQRLVIYREVQEKKYLGAKALTYEQVKQLLGYETEAMYSARVGVKTAFGDDFMFRSLKGEKVRCWNNMENRPFNEGHGKALAQVILTREWADSRNGGKVILPTKTENGIEMIEYDEMTVNGETIIITRTGQIDSGQHRLYAELLAVEMFLANPAKYPKWKVQPTLEAIIVFGVSDSPRVTMTLDNVRPRTLTDVLYTMETFSKLNIVDRREHSRMLAYATDLLWKRTAAATEVVKYQTHSASLDFIERHKKLVEGVAHIFKCNTDRSLTNLKLSPGHSAALLYLMGCCSTAPNDYAAGQPPSERLLDFNNWDFACEFWKHLSDTKNPKYTEVRRALAALADDESGGGRSVEKQAIICKAWNAILEDTESPVTANTVKLEYIEKNGSMVLDEHPGVGGIDVGPSTNAVETAPDASVEEQATAAREVRVKDMDAKVKDKALAPVKGTKNLSRTEQLAELRQKYPGKTLLFRVKEGLSAWEEDASLVAGMFKLKTLVDKTTKSRQCVILPEIADHAVQKLLEAKHDVAICTASPGGDVKVELPKLKPKK